MEVEARPGCDPRDVVVDQVSGQRICATTGEVIDEFLPDEGGEWRRYKNGEVKGYQRAQAITSYVTPDANAPTHIVRPKGKATRWEFSRLRSRRRGVTSRIQGTVLRDRDKTSLSKIYNYMGEIIRELNMPRRNEILNLAGWIIQAYYRNRKREGEENNRNIIMPEREKWAVAMVALKKALETFNQPLSEKELLRATAAASGRYSEEELRSQMWRVLKRINEYGITKEAFRSRVIAIQSITSRTSADTYSLRVLKRINSFIDRLVRELGLDMQVGRMALKFVRAYLESGNGRSSLYGRKPEFIAAAAVYFAARILDYNITQKQVADVFHLSEANVRKTLRLLLSDRVVVVFL